MSDDLEQDKHHTSEVVAGFGWTVLAHTIAAGLLFALQLKGREGWAVVPFFMFYGIGITQFVYVIPIAIHFKRKGRPGVAKGVVIAASITFLLNAACFGALMYFLAHANF